MVIFGANGDLTKRKLLPALYRLAYERRLPTGFSIVGVSRTEMTDEHFREKMREIVQEFLEDSPFDERSLDDFERGLFYMAGDVNDAGMYRHLAKSWMRRRTASDERQCSVLSVRRSRASTRGSRRDSGRRG